MVLDVAVIAHVGVTLGFTVMVIILLVTVVAVGQATLLFIVTYTCVPFVQLEALYPLPFVETIEPLTYHTYDGLVPPLLGNPVNTSSPFAHVDVALAESETEGVTELETVSVTLLLVTFATVGHAALVVNTQVIISPFTQELAVYVAELVPTFEPFFFH